MQCQHSASDSKLEDEGTPAQEKQGGSRKSFECREKERRCNSFEIKRSVHNVPYKLCCFCLHAPVFWQSASLSQSLSLPFPHTLAYWGDQRNTQGWPETPLAVHSLMLLQRPAKQALHSTWTSWPAGRQNSSRQMHGQEPQCQGQTQKSTRGHTRGPNRDNILLKCVHATLHSPKALTRASSTAVCKNACPTRNT
eukprot:2963395-Amphidinium_carterae.2